MGEILHKKYNYFNRAQISDFYESRLGRLVCAFDKMVPAVVYPKPFLEYSEVINLSVQRGMRMVDRNYVEKIRTSRILSIKRLLVPVPFLCSR